jgi:Skp family chaperone for outer membrane proteins
MTELVSESMFRMLRDIRRTLAGYEALFNAQREEIAGLRSEMYALRAEMKQNLLQQHAILAHNATLIDEQAERLDALERS